MNRRLVDDDVRISDALTGILEEARRVVASGPTDLRPYQRWPHLILPDLAMPVVDGTSVRVAQVADLQRAALPVFVLLADRSVQHTADTITADACVAKPMRLDDRLALVDRFVPKR